MYHPLLPPLLLLLLLLPVLPVLILLSSLGTDEAGNQYSNPQRRRGGALDGTVRHKLQIVRRREEVGERRWGERRACYCVYVSRVCVRCETSF